MPVTSKHEDKMYTLQSQLRENQSDLTSFLGDLDKWTSEIKSKDESLKKQKEEPSLKNLPPIRNSKSKKKKKKEKTKNGDEKKGEGNEGRKAKRISSYDYRSWDKFDVDKACEEVDDDQEKSSSSETESDSDEEWEKIALQQRAIEEKNKGNEYFNKGEYELAVEWYTKGINSDPTNALLPANRAMALLKLHRYGAAEVDANQAIVLDPMYYKAYLRRAAARVGLKKYDIAVEDYKKLLTLDPGNKVAKTELQKLEKEMKRSSEDKPPVSGVEFSEEGLVKPIYKSQDQRSKKPLKRIEIQEIGIEEDTSRKSAIEKTKAKQSDTNKLLTEKESKTFERFTEKTPSVLKLSTPVTQNIPKQPSSENKKIKIEEIPSASDVKKDKNDNVSKSTRLKIEEVSSDDSVPTKSSVKKSVQKPVSPRILNTSESPADKKIPTTSVQFQADYKELKHNLESFYTYFKRIEPSTYPKIFGEFLDSDILLNIMTVLNTFYVQNGNNCYNHVKYLAQVKRFSMTVMFLSKKEQEGIKEILKFLEDNKMAPIEDIQKLKKTYQL